MSEKINVTLTEQQGLNVVLSNATVGTGTATSDYNDLTNKPTINGQVLQGDVTITGTKGDKGDKGDKGEQGIQGIQGIQGERGIDGINGKDGINGTNGVDGANGISPTVTVATNTDTEYTLSITDATGTITTPNLKGRDGTDGTSGAGGGGTSTTTFRDLVVHSTMTKMTDSANYIAITGNKVEIFFNLTCNVSSMNTALIFQIPSDLMPSLSYTTECLCVLGYSDTNGVYSGILTIHKDNLYYDGYATCFCKYGTKELHGYLTYYTDVV